MDGELLPKIVYQCVHHGQLTREQVNRAGKHSSGKPAYKCKACQKERHRKHYQKHKDKVNAATREYKRRWKEERPEHYREYRRAEGRKYYIYNLLRQKYQRDELYDWYIRSLISDGTKLSNKDIPIEVVNSYRELIKIRREIRERKKNMRDSRGAK